MSGQPEGGEPLILLLAWLLAVVAVVIAYIIAGPVWVRRHSLHFRVGSAERRASGAYGEIVLVSFGAAMVWMIDSACPDVTLDGIIAERPLATLAGLIGVGLIVYIHGVRTALAADAGERRPLFFTYLVYGIFSVLFFAGGAALIAMLVKQALADGSRLQALAQAAIGNLPGSAASDSETLMRGLEMSYLDIRLMLSQAENSMTPVFVFLAGIFAINLAVRLTPLRSLFINNAVLLTLVSTMIGILSVIIVGTWTYVGSYASVISEYVDALIVFRQNAPDMKPEYVTRYSEITVAMIDQKSVLAFVTRISSEWGGVAAALGIAQWVAEQLNRPEAKESPAHAAPAPEAETANA